MNKTSKFSPEVRERAVRMVQERTLWRTFARGIIELFQPANQSPQTFVYRQLDVPVDND